MDGDLGDMNCLLTFFILLASAEMNPAQLQKPSVLLCKPGVPGLMRGQ